MVTVTGTVTDFQFINPHVMITMDVKDPSTGKIEKWEGELTSPNHLERAGWTKSTIKVGDEVTMTGSALKSGAPAMAIRKVMKNGQQIGSHGRLRQLKVVNSCTPSSIENAPIRVAVPFSIRDSADRKAV